MMMAVLISIAWYGDDMDGNAAGLRGEFKQHFQRWSVDSWFCGMLAFLILSADAEIQALYKMRVVNRYSVDKTNSMVNVFGKG